VDEHIDAVKLALERNLKRQLDSAISQKDELMQAIGSAQRAPASPS
jgi:hypothetical protein